MSDNILQSHNECALINTKCLQQCVCGLQNNITTRIFFKFDLFDWECKMYLKMLKYNITPLILDTKSYKVSFGEKYYELRYDTRNLMSLRTLVSKSLFSHLIINELFSFVTSLLSYGFIHGNLHVDNILYDQNEGKFYVIDLVNSYYMKDVSFVCPFVRTSYIEEYDDKIVDNDLEYWDIFTLVTSLLKECCDVHSFGYIDKIIESQVNTIFQDLTKKYNDTLHV